MYSLHVCIHYEWHMNSSTRATCRDATYLSTYLYPSPASPVVAANTWYQHNHSVDLITGKAGTIPSQADTDMEESPMVYGLQSFFHSLLIVPTTEKASDQQISTCQNHQFGTQLAWLLFIWLYLHRTRQDSRSWVFTYSQAPISYKARTICTMTNWL